MKLSQKADHGDSHYQWHRDQGKLLLLMKDNSFRVYQKEGESSEALHYHQQSFGQTRDSKPNQFKKKRRKEKKQEGRATSG